MNEVCKVCAAGVGIKFCRRNLVGRADGVREVYGLLLDTLVASCSRPERLAAAHGFLSADPAFLCKGCFTTLKKFCDLGPQVKDLKRKILCTFTAAHVSTFVSTFVQHVAHKAH